MGLRPILCANDCFAKRTFLSIIKPTPDWKDGAARPPQAGRSESVVLESGFANKSGSIKNRYFMLTFLQSRCKCGQDLPGCSIQS